MVNMIAAGHSQNDNGPEGGLSKAAYDEIMRLILARELSAGQIVQERRLADRLNMSRTPVREALRKLEAESWLVRLNSRTIAVKRVSIEEYLSALQIRELLEPEAAAIAAPTIESTVVLDWRHKLKVLMELDSPSPKQQWEFDQSLHMGIANASKNTLLPRIISELRKTTQLFENQTLPTQPLPGYDEHMAIIDAVEKRDPLAARDAMRTHLKQTKKSIFEVL
jgi:DNA-binding GntR family transcriptional regulator